MSLAVLIVGLNFAPEPTGIAPYTTAMAAGLRDRGHDVRVLTAYPHYPAWRVSDGYRGHTHDDVVRGLPVRRVRHYVPARPTRVRRMIGELTFGARLVLERWGRPDVILCPSPALLSTAMAVMRAHASRRDRPAVGVIVQDLYSAGVWETGAGAGLAARSLSDVEARVLGAADGVSVIHHRFKRRVVEQLGVRPERVEVIRNWTHIPPAVTFDRGAFRQQMGWGPNETVVLHAGAMGDKQELGNVVVAGLLAEQRGAPLRFVLLGEGKHRVELERRAAGCGMIQFIDPLPAAEYVKAMHAADILLVNERPGVVDMAVPSKLTSYFSTGRPVLAATGETSVTAEEVARSGAGVRVEPGDPKALVTGALRLRDDPALAVTIGSRGLTYSKSLLSEQTALDAYDRWVRQLHAGRQ